MEDISILSQAAYDKGEKTWNTVGAITADMVGDNQRDITSFWAGYLSASILED
jgi:hypothetical protein